MTLIPRIVLIFLAYVNITTSSKILAVLPVSVKSHYALPDRLLVRLAELGHDVTVYSPFPKSVPIPNYTEVNISQCFPPPLQLLTLDLMKSLSAPIPTLMVLVKYAPKVETFKKCEPLMQLLNSGEKYDLLVLETFYTDVTSVFASRFQTPFVNCIPNVLVPWLARRLANPDNPSYMRNLWSGYGLRMSFMERVENTVVHALTHFVYGMVLSRNDNRIVQELLESSDVSIYELIKQTSLTLINSHSSINPPISLVPGIVEVGGLHIKDANALPEVCIFWDVCSVW